MTRDHAMTKQRHRRGASVVEFALTVPVLLILTMGTFDFCWYFTQWQQILASAQVGARAGSQTKMDAETPPDLAGAEAAAEALRAHYLGVLPEGSTVTGTIVEERMVRIDVAVPYSPLIGLVPTPPKIRATSQMLIEDAH